MGRHGVLAHWLWPEDGGIEDGVVAQRSTGLNRLWPADGRRKMASSLTPNEGLDWPFTQASSCWVWFTARPEVPGIVFCQRKATNKKKKARWTFFLLVYLFVLFVHLLFLGFLIRFRTNNHRFRLW